MSTTSAQRAALYSSTPTNFVILEDGEQGDVTEEQGNALVEAGLIYACDDPECGPFYHIDPEHTWADVDAFLAAG